MAMDHRAILALIEAYDRTTEVISAAAISAFPSAANELVVSRRDLARQGLEMSRAIEEQLAGPLLRHPSHAASELRAAYAERTNKARVAIATHQAKWPAIKMRDAIADYRGDVKRLHLEQQGYRAWLKTQFVPQAAELLSRAQAASRPSRS
ncbi:hypothetical protein ACT009_14770 [Sphingomonas sp. Tas61C01]|uniref:hypothetical protein n=1 Tax=Sphingomonas sp. Tas61C01 TaxID=3458297 RepID=UPI00403E892E